jgi:prepilin-type N-terminal cleavage/methylation domain-containing protein
MKALHRHASRASAFTLLEVIIVLAITALVLGAVYSLGQGTLMLADDVRRAERRDARTQAFATFCEQMLMSLPATALLKLSTTQEQGQYLTRMELEHVRSPFDETLDCRVALFTKVKPGGGMHLMLTCGEASVVLFEDLVRCEWSALQPATQLWVPFWTDGATHPKLLKLVMTQAGGDATDKVFWIAPMEAVALMNTQPLTQPITQPNTQPLTQPNMQPFTQPFTQPKP